MYKGIQRVRRRGFKYAQGDSKVQEEGIEICTRGKKG